MATHEFHSFYYDRLQQEPVTEDFRLPAGTEMTPGLLTRLIGEHRAGHVPRYEYLEAAYRTQYGIFSQGGKPDYKPDNRLAADFAYEITETFEGFFIGVPVDLRTDDEADAAYLDEYQKRNDQEDVDAELSAIASKLGKSYEMFYQDEDGRPRSAAMTPMCSFGVYDDSVLKRPMYFVTYLFDEGGNMRGHWSDAERVTPFAESGGAISFGDAEEHFFGDVPFVQYQQNSEARGLYEGVLNLIEAYNRALSDKSNDVEYFADAYMVVEGMKLPDGYKTDLRENKLINLWGNSNLDVRFLQKPDADASQENLINRLEMLIFKMAMVPDITDESFSTASGTALKFRLTSMNNLARKKERKFKSAVRQRLRLLANYPEEPFKQDAWQRVEITMHRNLPEDLEAEVRVASGLSGIVSEETQLSVLSCVDSPVSELARKRAEQDSKAQAASEGMPTARTASRVDATSMYKITSILNQWRRKSITRNNALSMLQLIGLDEETATRYLDDKDDEEEQ